MTLATSVGTVGRVVDDSLAYLTLTDVEDTLCFVPGVLDGYRGQSFAEYGILPGAAVAVEWDVDAGTVVRVALGSDALREAETRRHAFGRGGDGARERKASDAEEPLDVPVIELEPGADPKGKAVVLSALPLKTRQFGKIVDTSALLPGDLMLARECAPDKMSEMIVKTQEWGGYHSEDAKWSHAAMYLGDGASVIEATTDLMTQGSVRVTSLFDYSQGAHVLRFRRPRYVSDDRQRWRLCIRAMTRLGREYGFAEAVKIWFNVVVRGRTFISEDMRRYANDAVICSLLYADAYGEAVRRSLGEREGVCVPAWLSGSDEFEDIAANWLKISR